MLRNINISNALKGRNHQHRATPCDWIAEPLQALQGRQHTLYWLTPLQGLHLRVFPFHRALPDAHAKRLSAFAMVIKPVEIHSYKLFIFNPLIEN